MLGGCQGKVYAMPSLISSNQMKHRGQSYKSEKENAREDDISVLYNQLQFWVFDSTNCPFQN